MKEREGGYPMPRGSVEREGRDVAAKGHLFTAVRLVLSQLNHFPGSFQIGRKDRLWRNLSKMQARFGKKEFNFFPQSFILPQDIKLLRKAWEESGSRQKWIVKPVRTKRGQVTYPAAATAR